MSDRCLGSRNNHWWYEDGFHIEKGADNYYTSGYFAQDGNHINDWEANQFPEFMLSVAKKHADIDTLVEVGAGGGWFTEKFVNLVGGFVEAVEFSQAGRDRINSRINLPDHKFQVKDWDVRYPLSDTFYMISTEFDLAVCMEVAEHLEPPFAATLVYNLTLWSDLIYFTGCEPRQPKYNSHPNEQPYQYWINLFDFYGFEAVERLQGPTVLEVKDISLKGEKMPSKYKNIEGWCDYVPLYEDVVKHFPNGSEFVELGSWKGQSACAMLELFAEHGKDANVLHCVDTWTGHAQGSRDGDPIMMATFAENLQNAGLGKYYECLKMYPSDSTATAEMFKDNTLSFVFIDDDHNYQRVYNNIIAWRPKLKADGWIAGHDYPEIGVRSAVHDLFSNVEGVVNMNPGDNTVSSWLVRDVL